MHKTVHSSHLKYSSNIYFQPYLAYSEHEIGPGLQMRELGHIQGNINIYVKKQTFWLLIPMEMVLGIVSDNNLIWWLEVSTMLSVMCGWKWILSLLSNISGAAETCINSKETTKK